MGTVGLGQHNVTPAERFRDLTGAHPVIWFAFVATLTMVFAWSLA